MKSKTLKLFVILLIFMQVFSFQVYAKKNDKKDVKAKTSTSTVKQVDNKKEETKKEEVKVENNVVENQVQNQTQNQTQNTVEENQNENQEENISQDTEETDKENNSKTSRVQAKVIEAGKKYERDTNGIKDYVQDVTVKIIEGDRKEEKVEATYVLSMDVDNKIIADELDVGNKVFVQITEENGEVKEVIVQDIVRHNYMLGLVIFFFASIILVGRKKGIKSILGLIVTVVSIYLIFILNVYKGYNAILLSIITSFIIIVLTFIIIDGINKKTFSAALGTLGGVVFAGVIAFIFGKIAKLTGGQEEAIMLTTASNVAFNFRDLLFSGIVISALGACMDVGMSIASSLSELKEKNPEITWKELFKSGMKIGGDMIGTMTNTLILAFVGCSLNLILLSMSVDLNFIDMINVEAIASEAMCSIAGSIGVVYTVPITAFIFSMINKDKNSYKTKSENIVEGKRSLKI